MYAAGAPHRHKQPSAKLLETIATGALDAGVDAEVLQEVLHRYRMLGQWELGRRVYTLARRILPVVVPITAEILDAARALLDGDARLTARDALHAAACDLAGARALCSYDRDFDRIPGMRRVEPDDLI